MRVLSTFFILAVLPSFASAAFNSKACLESRLKQGEWDSIYAKSTGITEAQAVEWNELPQVKAEAEIARQMANEFGIPDFRPGTTIKTKDGETTTIPIPNFHTLDWKKPEKKQKFVESQCSQFGELAKFCVSSLLAKLEHFDTFLKVNQSKIQKMADEKIKDPTKTWEQLLGNTDFALKDGLEDGLAASMYIQDNHGFLDGYEFDKKTDRFVGRMLPIQQPGGGSEENYFAPIVGRDNAGSIYLNPYFFVFGHVSAQEWNSYWERKLGISISK